MNTAMLHFTIAGPDGRRAVTREDGGPVVLGRDAAADIRLDAKSVSRRHAVVEWTPEGLQVTDTSSNGTQVDGTLLRNGVRIVPEGRAVLQLGAYTVRVLVPLDAACANELVRADGVSERADPGAKSSDAPDGVLPVSGEVEPAPADIGARRLIHRRLLEYLDLPSLGRAVIDAADMRPKVVAALRRIVTEQLQASDSSREDLVQELADEALGLGPLEQLLADPEINEIMVVDPHTIFVERRGKMELTGRRFTDADSVRATIERIVTPLGRRIDESTPLVDARLRDGSRVNAVIPPLALRGPCITIRKFAKRPLGMQDLVAYGSLTPEMARFLEYAVRIRKNIVISGGTGSGKTTLLNVLSRAIPEHERVVTVEDAAELQLAQPHVVSLEARPPNLEGKGEYSIRDLVKNALRMRPDRIVVGECRGGEAIDMLQAMNTGHEGSLTTTHANSPREAVARIETLCLMAGLDLPIGAVRRQIASSIHLFVQQARASDGSRRVTSITEVVGVADNGEIELCDIFTFKTRGLENGGKVRGEFLPSGYLPSFLDQFVTYGLANAEEPFL